MKTDAGSSRDVAREGRPSVFPHRYQTTAFDMLLCKRRGHIRNANTGQRTFQHLRCCVARELSPHLYLQRIHRWGASGVLQRMLCHAQATERILADSLIDRMGVGASGSVMR